MTTNKKLSRTEKSGYAIFSAASNIMYQFKSIYYLFFLTNVVHINVGMAGMILTIGLFWDAINDPMAGFWALNHTFKNGEKYRPLALWTALPWGISMVLMFTDFRLPETPAVYVALCIYLIFEIFNTLSGIPYNAMASVATKDDTQRRSLNVYRNFGASLGGALGSVAILPLLRLFGSLDDSGNLIDANGAQGFLMVAIIMGVLGVFGSIFHFMTTRERIHPKVVNEKISFQKVLSMLLTNKYWILNSLYVICYGIINLMLMSTITYYATYVLGSTEAATPLQAAYLVSALLSAPLVGRIDEMLGRRGTMIFGAIVFILGKVWFVINPYSLGAIYVNAISVGFAVTLTYVMFNTNRNNLTDLIEFDHGHRIDSMVSTVDNLASKTGTALAALWITSSLNANGFDASISTQPAAAINTLNAFLGWIPMLISVVMLIVVWFLRIDQAMDRIK